jgi:hypothetical protein
MQEFNFVTLENLNASAQKNYIIKYFVPLYTGEHAVYLNGKWKIMTTSEIKNVYFNRFETKLTNFYFKEHKALKNIVYKINEPVNPDELNICPPLKHTYKPFDEFDEETKNKVKIMLNFIKEILANNNTDVYNYLLKWLAYMLQGFKNSSVLYLRGRQGLGKSTLFNFIQEYVIGYDLAIESGSEPLRSQFNNILGGKLMVVFEELETFSMNEWFAISSRLKRMVTSSRIQLEQKGIDAVETNNLNNYILLTNNDAIKDDDGRRYFILDLATHRIGDKAYWNNIHSNCFNDEVGKAFYCYFCDIDVDNFNSQNMPLTISKIESCSKRLESPLLFLKDEYILKRRDLNDKVMDIYNQYVYYCKLQGIKEKGKINFNKDLESFNIKYETKKINNTTTNKYIYSYEKLQEIANNNHWLNSLDEYASVENTKEYDTEIVDEDINDIKQENENLKLELERLKKELEEFKAVKPQENAEPPKKRTYKRKLNPNEPSELDNIL